MSVERHCGEATVYDTALRDNESIQCFTIVRCKRSRAITRVECFQPKVWVPKSCLNNGCLP